MIFKTFKMSITHISYFGGDGPGLSDDFMTPEKTLENPGEGLLKVFHDPLKVLQQ